MQRAARIVAAVPVSADSWLASSFSSGHCRCYCHKGVNQISRWFSQQPIMTLLLDNWQKITAKIRTCLERSLTDRIFANQTTFFGEGLYTNIRILNGHFQIQNNVFIIQRFLSRHHLRILCSAICRWHLDRPHWALQHPGGWCWPRSAAWSRASSPDGSIVTAEPRYSVDAVTTHTQPV